jgi:hypothetical protein
VTAVPEAAPKTARLAAAAPPTARVALFAAGILALFAVLFTAGSALGAWPELPPGAFLGWDLWAGLAVGLALGMRLVGLGRGDAEPARLE